MSELQQLLATFNNLEQDMQRYSALVKEAMTSITMQEFVPEKVNTEMMQCIMELNTKQKECLKLYKQANLGESVPKKMHIMREQIERRMKDERKLEYLEAVKKSFLSLYTEDADVQEKLQGFKDKVVTIKVEKYPLEKCLVYIRPFAVFLTMIKSDDPVKAIEQVPVLNEYFGSALVAHITISKDIFIGEDAKEFNLEGEEASDQSKDSAVKKETVQNAESSVKKADTAKEQVNNPGVTAEKKAAEGTMGSNTASTQAATPKAASGETPSADVKPQAAPAGESVSQQKQETASQAKAEAPAATEAAAQPKAEAPAVSEPVEQPKAEAPATSETASQPKAEAPAAPEATAQPKAEAPAAPEATAQPKAEAPAAPEAAAQPKTEAPAAPEAASQPKTEAPVAPEAASQPKTEAPAATETPQQTENTSQAASASQNTNPASSKKEAPVAKQKRVHPDNKKRSKPKKPRKVDVKALLEEEGFREDRLDDPELKKMQEQEKRGKKGKKDSNASVLKGTSNLGQF